MLKIHRYFFYNFLYLFLGTIVVASFLSYYSLKEVVLSETEDKLKKVIDLISLNIGEVENLDNYVSKLTKLTHFRITVVGKDGLVLAESFANKEKMENHLNRYEIKALKTQEYGLAIRYSHTVKENFMYMSKKISYNNKIVYLRVAKELSKIIGSFYSLWIELLGVFAFIAVLAMIISYNMSKKIDYDISQIINYLDEVSNKNYKSILIIKYFQEFLKISIVLKDLVKKLHQRDKQRRKYTAKLRLSNKQRNDILSAVSHEFKNPIASIMGYSETIIDDEDMPEKIKKKFLGKIVKNSKKITDMIDRLALSVKLENGDLSLEESEFNIKILVKECITNIKKKYKDREIKLEAIDKKIYADKTMIDLVVTNLLDNALKYSEGDVLVTITKDSLSVTDQGIGIDQNDLNKIGSKFYRVEKNTWDNSMGLGLAIVTFILGLHDKRLNISSKLNEGSTFSIDI